MYNDISLSAYLMQRGANPLLPNEAGKTAIDICTYFKFSTLERLLISGIFIQPNCMATPQNPSGAACIDCPPLFELTSPVDPHLSVQLESLEQNCYSGSNLAYITAVDGDDGSSANGKSSSVCWTGLMKAAYRGQVKIATWLVTEQKVSVTSADPKGYTALHWAALNGHLEIVTLLVTNGAEVNCCSPKTLITPLHCACYNGDPSVVKYLLESGAEANTPQSPVTPLMIASWRGLTTTVTFLLANGAKCKSLSWDFGSVSLTIYICNI